MTAESKGVKTTEFLKIFVKMIIKGHLKQHTDVFKNASIFV